MTDILIRFTENGSMIVKAPYNRDFIDALGNNNIQRKFHQGNKAWGFHGKDAGDVLKLIEDYYEEVKYT